MVFKFKETEEASNPLLWLENAINEILGHLLRDADPSDRVGMTLRNDNYPEKPIGISFRRVDQLNAKVVMATLEKILQSNANFFSNDALRLHMDRVSLPVGFGASRDRMTGVSYEEFCRRKRGILVVENDDTLCLARALVLAIAWKAKDPLLYSLQLAGNLQTKQRAEDLCRAAEVNLNNGGNREHIQQFQDHLVDYTVVVYNNRLGTSVYYEGPRSSDRTVLNLILENNHYNVITNVCSAFSTMYFCDLCRARTNNKRAHKNCKYICPACHSSPPCNMVEETVVCTSCHRDFRGQDCYEEHKKSLCIQLKRCQTCFSSFWVDKRKPHICGYKHCASCKIDKPIRHHCFMTKKPVNKKKMDANFVFVFYDFECRQDTPLEGATNMFLHIPTLCVAQQVCKSCITIQNISEDCRNCGRRQHIFKKDPVGEFLDFVANLRKRCKGYIVTLAHNMKGYDGTFILKTLLSRRTTWNPKIIATGTKLMSINCDGNIKFIDSINYMPMPLAKLPKTFGFSGSKGFFPHFFNTAENQDYVGPLPSKEFYGYDEMTDSTRDEFISWYEEQVNNNVVFNFQSEIVKYCISDVDILRKACLDFWSRFTKSNGVDPFRESCTIAGACNTVFRRHFLKDDTIGLIPPNGYRMADQQSSIAIKWLLWLEHSSGITIQHAGNGREVRLQQGILVDGFCARTNTVYQFHGCYFHGCEICFPNQTAELGGNKNESMSARREKTEAISARIRSYGYNLIEIKECQFKSFLKTNIQANQFVSDNDFLQNEPLNPRDSFFGGRTNAVKLYHKSAENETIRYLDVCSLYPYVNKYKKYPLGHPKIHVGNNACQRLSLDTVEGIIKCTILPPTNLYHPVLPCRMHGKLMFILCRVCGETMSNRDCNHTDNERKFTGTFVADEVREALSQGYKVLEVSEVWEYEVVEYNKDTRTGGLFSSYVDKFLKLKQECSGWPTWCTSEQLKDRYVREYLEKEGVALDKDNISLLGKICTKENLMQCSILQDPYELFKMLTDPSVEAHMLTVIDDDTVILNWDRPDDGIVPLKTVNVALAAYTTAHARLELYTYLKKLDKRVLYFDTDSVIFTEKSGDWIPRTGDYLGNMTDEIESYGPGSRIVEFVSGGPKNYALKIFSTKNNKYEYVCKVKGIVKNFKNAQTVNFEHLKNMVLGEAEATYVNTDRRIVRNSMYDVISKPERKVFRVNYTKRRRVDDTMDTLPYGYRNT
ncbi:hypothetical protein RN001_005362 [Aquatica leii]|uniref:DNA-directed DNA polymerase n=1 Tax=Aquatica leii TaxID=1421715 RepID=A0AAN7SPU3_9COLE|nr:hypothetical protein RN001_005362 [Aquatica leii]